MVRKSNFEKSEKNWFFEDRCNRSSINQKTGPLAGERMQAQFIDVFGGTRDGGSTTAGISSTNSRRPFKKLAHSYIRVFDVHISLYTFFKFKSISDCFNASLMKNFTAYRCSTESSDIVCNMIEKVALLK